MIDSSTSHCFIAAQVASRLQLPTIPNTSFSVRLGDGTRVRSSDLCMNIALFLSTNTFSISCYVFPLRGVDMILGISWLATLGDGKAHCHTFTIEFTLANEPVKLCGDPALVRQECSIFEIHSLAASEDCWMLWAMEREDTTDNLGLDEQLHNS